MVSMYYTLVSFELYHIALSTDLCTDRLRIILVFLLRRNKIFEYNIIFLMWGQNSLDKKIQIYFSKFLI